LAWGQDRAASTRMMTRSSGRAACALFNGLPKRPRRRMRLYQFISKSLAAASREWLRRDARAGCSNLSLALLFNKTESIEVTPS